MNRALFTAVSGLSAQQRSLDVVANNLANANTIGFKKSRAEFQDLMYQQDRQPGTQTGPSSVLPTGTQIGLGVSSGTTTVDFAQGTPQSTGGDYDLAISGQGFFKVLQPDGSTAYTRSGNFAIDSQGKLVTSDGYAVQPEITIPPNHSNVSVSSEGVVSVTVAGKPPQTVGQLQLSMFPNPSGLNQLGRNLYQISPASGNPTDSNPGAQGAGTLQQKYTEASNVDIVEEMVRMIILQRAYDTNSKVVQSSDDMLATTNNLKR